MTTNTFETLSKISTILVTSAMLALPTVTAANAKTTGIMDVDGGHLLSICVLDGGDITVKDGVATCYNPKTGRTTTCSGPYPADDACWTEGRPTGGRFSKPVLNGGGTMVMPPDTNTTVGSGMNPLNGKLIMRNVIQN